VCSPSLAEWDSLGLLRDRLAELRTTGCNLKWLIVTESAPPPSEVANFAQFSWIEIIPRSPESDSFGAALSLGINLARTRAPIVVTMDADGSHDPSDISRLVEAVSRGTVCAAVASRYIEGGSSANGIVLRAMSRTLNRLFSFSLGIDLRDISNNFKCFRSEYLPSEDLMSENFDAVEELLLEVYYSSGNLPIIEIPSRFHERSHGVSKRRLGPFIVSYFWALLRLKKQIEHKHGTLR